MVMSPPRPPATEFTFTRPAADARPLPQPTTPAVMEPPAQPVKLRPNYQMGPKGACLMELPLTQPYVWVHYKTNKLPVLEWRAELSQLCPAKVKEFQPWCLWAGNGKQRYGDWAAVPIMGPLQLEYYGLLGPSKPLTRLTLVLGLNEVHMSLLRVMLQAQILAEAGDRPPGKMKVTEAVQWAVSILGEDHLLFKATAAVFGCIPECRASSLALDSTGLTEFEGLAMELDVLLAGDLGRDTDQMNTENSYISATEADMEIDA